MPQNARLETRRRKRRGPNAATVALALALLVVVVGAAAGAVWWFLGSHRSAPPAAQNATATSAAGSASSVPAQAKAATTAPAKTSEPSSTTDQSAQGAANASPETLAAADASVSAAKKAAVHFPGAPSISPTTLSVNHLNPRHKYIALTLDDGYNYQPALLALLEQYHVHCTTFVIGSWAASNKPALKAMKDAGFEIANHSWSHPFLTRLSSAGVASELTRTQRVISSVTGVQAPYLRPPFGDTNPSVKAAAAQLGYRIVMWDRTFGDSGRGATPTKLYSNVVYSNGGVQPGDVILCHWGSKPSYEALKKILPDLQARGFQFVTISELIADSKGN
jgi:peptidoglycan/xylan/chitin deacetylase (PgdA/CDA1 family)